MIAKLRRNIRERGVRGTISQALLRLREGFTEEEVIVLLKELDEIVPVKSRELRVEDLEPRHLAGLVELNRKRGAPASADRYFENSVAYGFHGFVAFLGEEMVGYYWWVDGDNRTPHPDLWRLGKGFELEPGDVYGSSLYLLPERRGRGRAGDFLFQIETAFRDRGYRRIWGYVDKANRPARWLYSLRGYRPVWNMRNRRLVFFRWRKKVTLADGA